MCIKDPYPAPIVREALLKLKSCLIEAGKPIVEHYFGHIKSYFRKDTNGKVKTHP